VCDVVFDVSDALESFAMFTASLAGRKPAFFLGFDGSLSPIVPRPEEAICPRTCENSSAIWRATISLPSSAAVIEPTRRKKSGWTD